MRTDSASGRFDELDADRQTFISRCERFASYTIPSICPPVGYNQNNDTQQHDWQALGAQALNHLSTKLMLAMFAPSRPFFRLEPTPAMAKTLAEAGSTPADYQDKLSAVETEAVKQMDKNPIRPKLYDILQHLPCVGNVLMITDIKKKDMRVLGLKKYVVKRDVYGDWMEMVIKEEVDCNALDPDVKEFMGDKLQPDANDKVCMYRWFCRSDDQKQMKMDVWVDATMLPDKFSGKWKVDECPYTPLTWKLASGDDYGTGLVEDYSGDFAALSTLSESVVTAAVLSSEFRWLVNPAGMTRADEFEKSANGSALNGTQGDITLVQSGKAGDLQIVLEILNQYTKRIGEGFLLQSAVTRDAERVTAEEIRQTAEELETGLGGAYSRIATNMQPPIAHWLLAMVDSSVKGSQFEPVIVTGLAALSRAGDRDNLMQFLQDLTAIGGIPPDIQMRLRISSIQRAFAAARGLDVDTYVLSDQEYQQAVQQQQQAQAAQMGAETGAQVAAKQTMSTQPNG